MSAVLCVLHGIMAGCCSCLTPCMHPCVPTQVLEAMMHWIMINGMNNPQFREAAIKFIVSHVLWLPSLCFWRPPCI